MLVLSSPSGAGKTSIAKKLLEKDDNLCLSISCTTRKKRNSEYSGKDYDFISKTDFQNMINKRLFLEWAKVFDHYYGTPKRKIEEMLMKGKDILFDIDWQGTQQLADAAREDLVSVFILPPSKVELSKRLRARAQDPLKEVHKRMSHAGEEISHYREYDYIIINNDLNESASKVSSILQAERLKRNRLLGLTEFVKLLRV